MYRTELCLQVNRPFLRALEQNETTCLCVCFIPHRLQFSEAIFLHLARFAFVGRDDIRYLLQKQKIFGGKICTVFCHCEIALDVQVIIIIIIIIIIIMIMIMMIMIIMIMIMIIIIMNNNINDNNNNDNNSNNIMKIVIKIINR